MDRRRFLMTSLAGVLAAPHAAEAQQAGKVYRIGYLDPSSLSFGDAPLLEPALRERGWVKQRDYVIETRWADNKPESLTGFARELLRWQPNLLVARGAEAATAASRATRDIPIVFTEVADPVGAGLVATLARPGANVTGLASNAGEAAAKQLDLLREVVPRVSLIEVLWVRMSQPDATVWKDLQAAGHRLRITLRSTVVADQAGLQRALNSLSQGSPPEAALVYADELAPGYLVTLAKFGIRQRLPMTSNVPYLTWEGRSDELFTQRSRRVGTGGGLRRPDPGRSATG